LLVVIWNYICDARTYECQIQLDFGSARHKPRSSDTVVTELVTGCGIPLHSVPYNKQGMK